MKKQKHLPDFTILCRPEQNTIQNILSLMIFFFFTGSVCGYVWEVLIFLLKEGTFRNRGFLYGPWLPVYGIGAVLFSVVLSPRELLPDSSGKYKKNHPVTVFFLSTLLGSGLELVYLSGFCVRFWHCRRSMGLHFFKNIAKMVVSYFTGFSKKMEYVLGFHFCYGLRCRTYFSKYRT